MAAAVERGRIAIAADQRGSLQAQHKAPLFKPERGALLVRATAERAATRAFGFREAGSVCTRHADGAQGAAAYARSSMISTAASPPATVSLATLGTRSKRRGPAAPGFTTSRPAA